MLGAIKYTDLGRQIGFGVGVAQWGQRTLATAHSISPLGMVTTSFDDHLARAYALGTSIKNAGEFLMLPDWQKGQILYEYGSNKVNNFIEASPYEQSRQFGTIAPDIALTAYGYANRLASVESIAAKTVMNPNELHFMQNSIKILQVSLRF